MRAGTGFGQAQRDCSSFPCAALPARAGRGRQPAGRVRIRGRSGHREPRCQPGARLLRLQAILPGIDWERRSEWHNRRSEDHFSSSLAGRRQAVRVPGPGGHDRDRHLARVEQVGQSRTAMNWYPDCCPGSRLGVACYSSSIEPPTFCFSGLRMAVQARSRRSSCLAGRPK
jgi:hypothetical protein